MVTLCLLCFFETHGMICIFLNYIVCYLKYIETFKHRVKTYYVFINQELSLFEEIFVLTFKAYGPNAVRI